MLFPAVIQRTTGFHSSAPLDSEQNKLD